MKITVDCFASLQEISVPDKTIAVVASTGFEYFFSKTDGWKQVIGKPTAPTPWSILLNPNNLNTSKLLDCNGSTITYMSFADGEIAARSVNCHQKLVSLLSECSHLIDKKMNWSLSNDVEKILKQARGA